MAKTNDIPVEQISKLADDVRTIENFAANNNFDSTLVSAEVTAGHRSTTDGKDVAGIFLSAVALIAIIGVFTFNSDLSEPLSRFLFLIGILVVGLTSACVHLKFRENTVTWIVAISASLCLVVAAGIFTPREAIELIQRK